ELLLVGDQRLRPLRHLVERSADVAVDSVSHHFRLAALADHHRDAAGGHRFHCRDPEVLAVLRVFPLVHRETGSVPEYLGTTQGLAQLWSRHIWSNLDRRTIRGFPNLREVFPA